MVQDVHFKPKIALAGWKTFGITILFLVISPVFSQNTKGDRPEQGPRITKQAKAKPLAKKKKTSFSKNAGRRLSTRAKSPVGRVINNIRESAADMGKKKGGKAAGPIGRIYSSSPSERQKPRFSDASGKRFTRTATPSAARSNIYPQSGRYVNHSSSKPPSVKIAPGQGRIFGRGKVKPRSATGKVDNVFPQTGPYVSRRPREPGHMQKSTTRSLFTGPGRGRSSSKYKNGRIVTKSSTGAFVQRRTKDVYWGKFSKGEKPFTRDIAGGPIRRRNFKSPSPGLVGRDTLAFFGRRPKGDRASSDKYFFGYKSASRPGKAWKRGDISGTRLRAPYRKRKTEMAAKSLEGIVVNPRSKKREQANTTPLPPRRPGDGGAILKKVFGNMKGRKEPKRGGSTVSGKRWNNKGYPIDVRTGGPGLARAGRFQGNLKGRGKVFDPDGLNYSGSTKSRRPLKGGGSMSSHWNNQGNPIDVRTGGPGLARAGRFQGNLKGRGKVFDLDGLNYSGSTKSRRPLKGGGSISGHWNNKGLPLEGRGAGSGSARASKYQGNLRIEGAGKIFDQVGLSYSGSKKSSRPLKGGGSVKRNQWNNEGQPIARKGVGGASARAARFQGNIRLEDSRKIFDQVGLSYSGSKKTWRPPPGGGSVKRNQWNNNGEPIERGGVGESSVKAARFQGNIPLAGSLKIFDQYGLNYAGNKKITRPDKGGGSVKRNQWNNQNQPIQGRIPGKSSIRASRFQGNIRFEDTGKVFDQKGLSYSGNRKTQKPVHGGGSISGKLWNNLENPIETKTGANGSQKTSSFQGNMKASRPVKGGGSISGKIWNNDQEPIPSQVLTRKDEQMVKYANKEKKSFLKKPYTQNPNAVSESIKKDYPNESTFKVAGLQVKTRQSVYTQNPNSSKEALKVKDHGKAQARINNVQGNMKMRKFNDSDLHPDAKFAHGKDDNVKEERTLFTNMKLIWAKMFRKSDNQPDQLKERVRRPRYDKKEQGLWAD